MIEIDVRLARGGFSLDAAVRSDARVTGITGPSGSGKTTLLHAVAGLVRPRDGAIRVGGTTLFDAGRRVDLPPEKRGVGFVFQDLRLFPHRTVAENLRFGRAAGDARGPGFDRVVGLLDLAPLLDRTPRTLSGGEARRVAVGRALLARPRLLVLDEPLVGLDRDRARTVLGWLLHLEKALDLPMLVVSHRMSDLLALADHAVLLRAGSVVASGEPGRVLETALADPHEESLESLVPGQVTAVEGDLARVECGETTVLHAPAGETSPGDRVFVAVEARDVLLVVGDAPRTSARNVLPGRVVSLHGEGARIAVRLDAGIPLWAEVTGSAVRDLDLVPGREVRALLKARALRTVDRP